MAFFFSWYTNKKNKNKKEERKGVYHVIHESSVKKMEEWKRETLWLCVYFVVKRKDKKMEKKEDERVKRTEWVLERNNK